MYEFPWGLQSIHIGSFSEEWLMERKKYLDFQALCGQVEQGKIKVTPELIKSVTRPDWKRELIEAICLAKVRPKEEK